VLHEQPEGILHRIGGLEGEGRRMDGVAYFHGGTDLRKGYAARVRKQWSPCRI
jgi:hypothetical protein